MGAYASEMPKVALYCSQSVYTLCSPLCGQHKATFDIKSAYGPMQKQLDLRVGENAFPRQV